MFNNAGHALSWAYNTAAKPIVKLSGINQMRQASAGESQNDLLINLTVQDRHKQAINIIGMVERLADQAEREYIRAKFGREYKREDIRVLIYRGCEASGLGLGGQEPVFKVMRSYFGGNLPYRELRKMLACRDRHALMIKSCLYEVLDRYHDRAMADMTEIFERQGLIGQRVTVP